MLLKIKTLWQKKTQSCTNKILNRKICYPLLKETLKNNVKMINVYYVVLLYLSKQKF